MGSHDAEGGGLLGLGYLSERPIQCRVPASQSFSQGSLMSHFINPEKIKRIVAKQTETSVPFFDDAGLKGAIARSMRDVYEPLTL